VGGRGLLPTSNTGVCYDSNASARPGGLSSGGGGGIGNSARVSRLGGDGGARPARLLLQQEEALSGAEGCLRLCFACAANNGSKPVCALHIDTPVVG